MGAWLGVLVLVGSGTAAGVLFSVALSVVPAFQDLPADRYVEVHKLVGRRYDRIMPFVVLGSALLDTVLAAGGGPASGRPLFGLAAALGFGVAAVSQLGNVPINRRVKRLPAGPVPAGWADPRSRWRAYNLVRTYLAVAGFVVNAAAVAFTG